MLRERLETADRVIDRIVQHHAGGDEGSEITFEGGRCLQLAAHAGRVPAAAAVAAQGPMPGRPLAVHVQVDSRSAAQALVQSLGCKLRVEL